MSIYIAIKIGPALQVQNVKASLNLYDWYPKMWVSEIWCSYAIKNMLLKICVKMKCDALS